MEHPGHLALGTWSGGRFMHFGEPLSDERIIELAECTQAPQVRRDEIGRRRRIGPRVERVALDDDAEVAQHGRAVEIGGRTRFRADALAVAPRALAERSEIASRDLDRHAVVPPGAL